MAISNLSLVNQKLALANSLIANLNATSANSTPLQQKALVDATVFHLATALHFYTREVAERQGIKSLSSIKSVEDLSNTLKQMGRSSSEESELLALFHTTDAWLNQLMRYYNQLFQSPEKPKEKKAFGLEKQADFIELTEIESFVPLQPACEHLIVWLDSFRALVARQRETSAEY